MAWQGYILSRMVKRHLFLIILGLTLLFGRVGPVFSGEEAIASLQASLSRCLVQASDPEDKSLKDICPKTWLLLQDSDLAAALRKDWGDELYSQSLSDLQRLLNDYRPKGAAANTVDHQRLLLIVEQMDLAQEEKIDNAIWARILLWLQEFLGLDQARDDSEMINWLNGFELSEQAQRYIRNGVLWLIGLMALVIVVRELRLIRRTAVRQGEASKRSLQAPQSLSGREFQSLDEIAHLALNEQPPALLSYALSRLVQRGVLIWDDSQTNGELSNRVAIQAPALAMAFDGLLQGAERVLFGQHQASDRDLMALRETYAELEGLLPELPLSERPV